MLYIWNDFSASKKLIEERADNVMKPRGSLKIDGREVKPGETFEADPAFIEKLGTEIARKCKPVVAESPRRARGEKSDS